MVCERWCVTKLCETKLCDEDVCDQVVCDKNMCDKVVCERWCDLQHGCHQVPRLPRQTHVDVTKCHACHANSRGNNGIKREPSAHPRQPSAISAMPARQSEGSCLQVPHLPRKVKVHGSEVQRLPRKVKVYVAKCHTSHAR